MYPRAILTFSPVYVMFYWRFLTTGGGLPRHLYEEEKKPIRKKIKKTLPKTPTGSLWAVVDT